jgi:hypothetical protein
VADKVTRQLLKTSDGKPQTGKNVKLRPAYLIGSGSDISLPETPAGSGIYRSAADVAHGVYKEVIDNVETGETVVVEPGRACYAVYTDATKTALVDRLLTDVVRLSGFVADTDALPSSTNLRDAMIHAMNYVKTLVMTDDATLASDLSLSTKALYIDLNGKHLTLNAQITCYKAFIRNGYLTLMSGSRSINSSAGICIENVEIMQGADSQFTADPNDRYINVAGLPATIPGTVATRPIVIGCAGVSTADKLFLNSTKLGYLQNFVDSLYSNLLAIHNWLTSGKRTELDKFANAPTNTKNNFEFGDFVGTDATLEGSITIETLQWCPTVGTDANGKVVPSSKLANSAYSAATYADLSVDPINKRFINLTGNVTLGGSPIGGAPDTVFLMNSTGAPISVTLIDYPITVPSMRCVVVAWNYTTNKWQPCGV